MPICLPSHFLSLHHCQNPPKAFMEVPNFSHSSAWNHVKPDHHSYPHVPSCIPIAHSSLHHRGYSLSPLIPCMYLIPYHPCPHALTHYSPIFFLTFHYIIPIFSHHHPICPSSYPTHIHIPLNLSHSNKSYHLADYFGLCLSYCMDITISRCHFSQHDRKMLIGG